VARDWDISKHIVSKVKAEFEAEIAAGVKDPPLTRRRVGQCGRKGRNLKEVEALVRAVPIHERYSTRSLAAKAGMSPSTFRRYMSKLGIRACRVALHPLLQPSHQLRRCLWALGHLFIDGQRYNFDSLLRSNPSSDRDASEAPHMATVSENEATHCLVEASTEALTRAMAQLELGGEDDLGDVVAELEKQLSDVNVQELRLSAAQDEANGLPYEPNPLEERKVPSASAGEDLVQEAALALVELLSPSFYRPEPPPRIYFESFYDYVHVDEKWFYIAFDGHKLYLLPGEEVPYRAVQHKSHIIKVLYCIKLAMLHLFSNFSLLIMLGDVPMRSGTATPAR
jgi:hypothetical protein